MNWLKRLLGNSNTSEISKPHAKEATIHSTTTGPLTSSLTDSPVAPVALIMVGPVDTKILVDFSVSIVQSLGSGHLYVDQTTNGLNGSSLMVNPSTILDSIIIMCFRPWPSWLTKSTSISNRWSPAIMDQWAAGFENAFKGAYRQSWLRLPALQIEYGYLADVDILTTKVKLQSISCKLTCDLARLMDIANNTAH